MTGFNDKFYKDLFYSLDNNSVLMKVEPDGSYYPIWCSKEFTDMMEGTAEDFRLLESGGTMKTIHPDDRSEVAYLFRNRITRGGTNHLNVRKQTMTGKWIWVCIHYSFIDYNGGSYAYCTYFDITEIKNSQNRAEDMYNVINRELNSLADESLAMLRVNLTTGEVEEARGYDLYYTDRPGAKAEDAIKARIDNMLIKTERERCGGSFSIDALRGLCDSTEDNPPLVVFSRRQSGKQCFVKFSVSVRREPLTGDIIAFMTEMENNNEKVTEVLNSKVLASQYDMVSYIVGGSYGVVIGDRSNIKHGNIFPVQDTGSYMDYITGQVIPSASSKHHDKEELLRALSAETVESSLARAEPYTVDVNCEIDGEIYNKRFVFYTVDRETRFYILLKSDITDVIREQREKNEALALALEEARAANHAKAAFLSSMSHEIRTPMNAIIGLDNIALKEKDLSPETRDQLEKINGSAKHLLALINDILDMSRIESGRMVLKNEEFLFSSMLDQINTMINGQCRDKGLNYECRMADGFSDYYIGDDMKLKQVLINILGNAVKFTPAGGTVTFTVENAASYDDKCTIRFTIKDTGIGMDEEFIPKIFEAFSQEDDTAANRYGGTGLGMAITKNIVEMMNGNISVKSGKGKGTEFTVNVTLKKSGRSHDACETEPQNMRVLVIDDEEVDCEHAKIVLEEMGVTADICMSGDEAEERVKLQLARREEYDLILVDLKMPGADGIEVTRRLRELAGGGSAVIILTAYSWDDVEEEARKAGVDGFMSKPLFAAELRSKFRQVIFRRSVAAEEKKHSVSLEGRRVLLAEDVMINAEIMKKILSMKGMTADHAENGRIAADKYAESSEGFYDAILMDVRMPVMDGLQATAAIRAMERPDAKTIPIIAMTANAFDEDVQLSLQAGMTAHLSKPVEPERLYDTLSALIKK